VDSAFISAGLTADSINRYDSQALALALKYSIVYGKISSTSLVGFYSESANSLHPLYKPNIVKNYYGIFFDGTPLVPGGSADLNDGVVHELQKVSMPPAGTLVDVIRQTPNLKLLAAAIKASNLEDTYSKLFPPVYGGAPQYYTMFAPSDDAFKKF